jgi:hypothetical protein
MITNSFLFAFYFILCILILYVISKKSFSFALTFKQAALIFSAKVLIGCFYGYFFLHFYNGDDTWSYHFEALKEYQLLKSDPLTFFKRDIFQNGYSSNQFLTIFDSENSFSKDLQITLLIKLLAIFDLFSQGQYYINVIFYNVFVFWGSYYLFLAVSKQYGQKTHLWFLIIFFFPPLLFWTSGIRKDGLSFALLCGFIYQLSILFYSVNKRRQYIFTILIWLTLFLTRNFIGMSLIPVTVAWVFAENTKKNTFISYVSISFIFVALFFATSLLPDSFNLPLKVAQRQESFINLTGGSYLPIDKLNGDLSSYIKILPQALDHIFIRPYPWEANNLLYFFSFVEITFFFFVIALAAIMPSRKFKTYLNDPLILSMFTVSLINYLLIGYTVPFMGAFIRYRSIFEIFFLIVAINFIQFDFSFLQNIMKIKSSVQNAKMKNSNSMKQRVQ